MNVKRRVYDALNVLYAAGVLKKEGKLVSCDPRDLHKRINSKAGYESGVEEEDDEKPQAKACETKAKSQI